MKDCEVLLGVKEVPIRDLIPNTSYFFFSHTIKKQAYNRELLQAVLKNKITLYDHEVITNAKGQRLVAFGRYAGLVGAYHAIRTYGLKQRLFSLPQANDLKDLDALIAQLRTVNLPANVKIVLTGTGRVGNGAAEILDAMGLIKVCQDHFLDRHFEKAVYCQIDVLDYHKRADGQLASKQDFFKHPELYISDFKKYTEVSDIFIAGHFYGQGAPAFFRMKDIAAASFKPVVIADISCDIGHPIPTTLRASTIKDPIYGVDRATGKEVSYLQDNAIAVMAVDNLPCELPADASEGFGAAFMEYVIPAFFNGDKDGILARAKMTENGKLTPNFEYLSDFVAGKE
jgi:alanine dehydrogenase